MKISEKLFPIKNSKKTHKITNILGTKFKFIIKGKKKNFKNVQDYWNEGFKKYGARNVLYSS